MERKINRIKVSLPEKGKTNKWFAEQPGQDLGAMNKLRKNATLSILEMQMQISMILKTSLDSFVRYDELPEIERIYK